MRLLKQIGRPLLSATSARLVRLLIRNPDRSSPAAIQSILLLRLDELGDLVLTTPLLRELRHSFPESWITLVVQPKLFNLVEFCPYVNEVLKFDSDPPKPFRRLRLHKQALRLTRESLRSKHFDVAIVPRWHADAQYASFLAYYSGARRRIGYSEKVSAYRRNVNRGFDSLFTDLLYDSEPQHQVTLNLNMLSLLGASPTSDKLELWSTAEDESRANRLLERIKTNSGIKLIAFGIGAGRTWKQWPLSRFIQLAKRLSADPQVRIVAVGSAAEASLGAEMENQIGGQLINAVGQTTLRECYSLLKRCHLFVGNDAGPKHLAAAAGLPVVEISWHSVDSSTTHLESPERFRAWGVPTKIVRPQHSRVPCRNGCTARIPHCILGVEVEMVERAVKELLAPQ